MNAPQNGAPFVGVGETPALCRGIDWSATALGPVEQWPVSLRLAVRTCLESPFPINLWCGPDLVLIYNDAYTRVLGGKHPQALGRPGSEVWSEIWDQIRPMFERIREGGPPAYADDAPFVVRRAGDRTDSSATEPNAWFTFALSPVRDEAGDIIAFMNIVSETTARVQAEREVRTARAKAENAEVRLREVFTQAPAFMAVLRGENHVFEYVNASYDQLTGHRKLLGLPVAEALPEVRGQGFEELLDQVLRTGEPYVGREIPVHLTRSPGGEADQRFLDFVYYPITEADGTRTGVVAHGSDITEHVLSRREAHRARKEAEEASRAKSQFMANMSHEIRTPINAIIGYTDLLELGIAGPVNDVQRAQLERVRTSSRHLLGIVEDILDVAKVESGRITVDRERLPLADTVAAALALIGPQASDRALEVVDECATQPGIAYVGDEDRLRQILANLLSNAVKFTDPDGEIRVRCGTVDRPHRDVDAAAGGPLTWVSVSDTGVGIPSGEIEKIFRPFTQVEGGNTRTRGGTGLGLTISRHLARLMGGDITLESEEGAGSTFTVWLPSDIASLDETILEETRENPPSNLAVAGHALQAEISNVLKRYTDRLRREPLMSQAADLSEGDLEDHAASFLADVAQSLIVLENSEATPERLMQDGSEIQRLVAELHGRQRAQLGWTGEALSREWVILGEEIAAAIRDRSPQGSDVTAAINLLSRFLERAERISQRTRRNFSQSA